MDSNCIQLIGAIIGLLGSIILAFSLNKLLSEIRFSINAMATSIESVANGGDILIFTGLNKRLRNADSLSKWWIRIGIFCLATSTFLISLGLIL
jgi:hypothetical protein